MTDSQQSIQVSWVPTLATIAVSTVMGSVLKGMPGAILGFSASIVDEILIIKDVYDRHHIASSIFWLTTALNPISSYLRKIAPNYQTPINICFFTCSAVISSYSDDFLDYRSKIEIPLGSFFTINKLFDKKNISSQSQIDITYNKFLESPIEALNITVNNIIEMYNNDFLCTYFKSTALSSARVVLDNVFLHYLSSYSGNLFIITLINNYNHGEMFKFISIPKALLGNGLKIIAAYGFKSLLDYYIQTTEYSLTTQQLQMILERGTNLILEDGNGIKILEDKSGKEIVGNLTKDLFFLYYFGMSKLNDVFLKSLGFLISLSTINKLAHDSFAPYSLSLIPIQILLGKISKETKELSEQYSKARSKTWQVMHEIIANIEQINMRDGEEFAKYKYNFYLSEETNIAQKSEYLTTFKNAILQFIVPLNQLIDIVYIGVKVASKQLEVTNIPLIKSSIDTINSFLSGNLAAQIDNNGLIVAKTRVDKLFKIISHIRDFGIIHTWGGEPGFNFKNYSLMIEEKEIVRIDNLSFESAKIYAITGKSGCGKTSTLINVKSWVSGGLSSTGQISIGLINGQQPKIMLIDQKLYLPSSCTLLELIFFPNILAKLDEKNLLQLKDRVIHLLKQLEIDEFIEQFEIGIISRLDEKDFKLSGGQSKKIAIIQAILYQPNILIMDETFAGLDKKSIILVEQALKEYLPNSMILVVDHHAEDNNYNQFYEYKVQFENGLVMLEDIISKPIFDSKETPRYTAVTEESTYINGQCPNIIWFYGHYDE
jgi:ABC-type multidrug transport system ATPase subunit